MDDRITTLELQIIERLTRMETKLDGLSERLTHSEKKLDDLEKVAGVPNQDHENRIRTLERLVWMASGIATLLGAFLGTVAEKILGA